MPLTSAGSISQRSAKIRRAQANNACREYRSIFWHAARPAAASIRRLANLAQSARIKELSAKTETSTNSPLSTFLTPRFFQVLDHPIDEMPAEAARARLVPRFTIRTLLAMITLAAIVFVMIGTATRGQYWAWGVTIGLVSVIVTALAHAAWFGIVWMFMRISHGQSEPFESVARDAGTARVPEAAGAGSEMFSLEASRPKA